MQICNGCFLLGMTRAECEDLIRRLLCIDPRRRITVPEIVSHRWMRLAGDDSEFERLMSNSMNPFDEDVELNESVLEHMCKLGLDKDQVQAVCICSCCNCVTRAYVGIDGGVFPLSLLSLPLPSLPSPSPTFFISFLPLHLELGPP